MTGNGEQPTSLPMGAAGLRAANIRPTRQRLALAGLLAGAGRHVTADQLHREALGSGMRISLATVYNTLHEFSQAGLLRKVPLGDKVAFCTNMRTHHHFYHEDTGALADIPGNFPTLGDIPDPPPGTEIAGVEVIVRLRSRR